LDRIGVEPLRGSCKKHMTLKEQCASCKANWDGHCINGNDTWKSINSCNEVICEDYEKVEGQDGNE